MGAHDGRPFDLAGQDGPVAHFVLFDLLDGLVGFGHGERLGGGFDPVAGCDVEHLAHFLRTADWTAGQSRR